MAFKGYGVSRIDGKVVFIPYSAIGDEVWVEIVEEKKNYATGKLLEILAPSSWRVEPPCPYFGRCGGCQWQHIDYAQQPELKKEILKDIIGKLGLTKTVGNFLQLLLVRGRLAFLPQVAVSYGAFADELSGIIRPVLTSGMQLEASQVEEIKTALARSTGKQVVLQVEVDPFLIGGVVTKIGDKVFDGSVRTQLDRIEDILQKG